MNYFHSSGILKAVGLEGEKEFLCTFKIRCENLMLFSRIGLISSYPTDSASYEIVIPGDLSYRYDSVNFDSLKYCHIDFRTRNDSQIVSIKTTPFLIRNNPEKSTPLKFPLIRQIIVPQDKKGKEELFFNNWYLSAIDSASRLNEESKRIIDSISINKPSVQVYYDYVKSKFKYLDVQVGLGAIIPRDVNIVLKNKQGDCKDLANLLRTILLYKGFDASLALTATSGYFCDFNFPSLCSGNHVICVVKTDTAFIMLDATDITHRIGQPVQHLQERTLFITSANGPSYYCVPVLDPDENEYNIELDLKNKASVLDGNLKIVTRGFSDSYIRWQYSRSSNPDFLQFIKNELQGIFHTKEVDSIKYQISDNFICIEGKIKYFNKQYKADDVVYFFIDYIPSTIPRFISQKQN